MSDMIFIPINTPSSKNSKQFLYRGGRGFLVNSKTTTAYIKSTGKYYHDNLKAFKQMIDGLPKPYIIGMHFVRKTRQRFDFSNVVQIVQDLFVKHGFLIDDNMSEMFPVPFQIDDRWYSVDKDKPGVYIKVFASMVLTPKYTWHNDSDEYKKARREYYGFNTISGSDFNSRDLSDHDKFLKKTYAMTSNEYKKKYGKTNMRGVRKRNG